MKTHGLIIADNGQRHVRPPAPWTLAGNNSVLKSGDPQSSTRATSKSFSSDGAGAPRRVCCIRNDQGRVRIEHNRCVPAPSSP
jgi:hypothetical protein